MCESRAELWNVPLHWFSVQHIMFWVQGLQIADYHKSLLEATGKELLEEKAEALEVCEH
jgi:hypothetical protein